MEEKLSERVELDLAANVELNTALHVDQDVVVQNVEAPADHAGMMTMDRLVEGAKVCPFAAQILATMSVEQAGVLLERVETKSQPLQPVVSEKVSLFKAEATTEPVFKPTPLTLDEAIASELHIRQSAQAEIIQSTIETELREAVTPAATVEPIVRPQQTSQAAEESITLVASVSAPARLTVDATPIQTFDTMPNVVTPDTSTVRLAPIEKVRTVSASELPQVLTSPRPMCIAESTPEVASVNIVAPAPERPTPSVQQDQSLAELPILKTPRVAEAVVTEAEINKVVYTETVRELEVATTIDAQANQALDVLNEVVAADHSEQQAEILKAIDNLIAMPQTLELNEPDNQAEVEQKLEQLIIELFEAAEIEYTTELVSHFVELARIHYFDALPGHEAANEARTEIHYPKERGTNEFLRKLQAGAVTLRRAAQYAQQIGQSTLRLAT